MGRGPSATYGHANADAKQVAAFSAGAGHWVRGECAQTGTLAPGEEEQGAHCFQERPPSQRTTFCVSRLAVKSSSSLSAPRTKSRPMTKGAQKNCTQNFCPPNPSQRSETPERNDAWDAELRVITRSSL